MKSFFQKFFLSLLLAVSFWSMVLFANEATANNSQLGPRAATCIPTAIGIVSLDGEYYASMNETSELYSSIAQSIASRNINKTFDSADPSACVVVDLRIAANNKVDHIKLVIRKYDLALQGFVARNNTYYFFSDSNITNVNNIGVLSRQPLTISKEAAYSHLVGEKFLKLNTETTKNAVSTLSKYTGGSVNSVFTDNLVRVIFVTSEAFKFRSVFYTASRLAYNPQNQALPDNLQKFKPSLQNWSKLSNEACKQDISTKALPLTVIGNKNDIRTALTTGNSSCQALSS
ncbi:MAG: ribosome-inactivating family protein [Alphaproteobacteria bacterium]|jgi:hypothetical protein|nr:ribosome-inactivating family protein [Alphaproteobacteria bacterium]